MNTVIALALFFDQVEGKHLHTTDTTAHLEISRFAEIVDKIIPFFDKYPILGIKALDYSDFKEVVSIVKDKRHITLDGYNKIIAIKEGMNRSRS